MSAFLGPIHHWLYSKIQLQESLTQAVLAAALEATPRHDLESKLDATYGSVEHRPLEEVIDTANIHGWLQGQIGIAEQRFAAGVTEILSNDPAKMDNLTQAAYQLGQRNPLSQSATAPEVYQALNDVLLEGMPCDRVNEVLEQSEQRVTWRQTADLHLPFWTAVNGKIENYYLLRNAFISGSLAESRFSFSQADGQFVIEEV